MNRIPSGERSAPIGVRGISRRIRFRAPLLCVAALLAAAAMSAKVARAQEAPPPPRAEPGPAELPTVQVQGAREEKGAPSVRTEALPAQVNVIDAARIERLNIRSYSDLYRDIPGAQSVNFGQGDIGAPFTLRGFGGGSHGVATAVFIDGVPQNIPSGGIGGNGSSEYNWLTPEMIERVEVIKGPFSALYGDQALAGVINIVTRTCAPTGIALEAGKYGLGRVAGAGCAALGAEGRIKTFGVFEAFHSDGYRDQSKYDRYSLFGKLTTALGASRVSVRANAYRSDYQAPGYLSFDQFKAGLLDARSALFRTDGGDNTRYSLVATLEPRGGEAGWYASAYYDYFDRTRYGSFNAAMPLLQSEQTDERDVFGANLHYNWLLGTRGALTAGVQTRQDRGDIANFASSARVRTGVVNSDYGLDLRSYSAFVQAQYKLLDALKLVGGYRWDLFEQDIDNRRRPGRSGSGSQSIGSPRIGLVYTVNRSLSLFANAGEGFRSLGANELSPSGETGFRDFDLDIPEGETRDIGFNLRLGPVLLNGTYYHTKIQSELRQDPPGSGILVNIGDSERKGYELDARWFASDALTLYGSYAHVDAEAKNPINPAQTELQNVSPNLYTLGLEYTQPMPGARLLFDLHFQHVDREFFYIGDVERRTDIYQIYNARLTYEAGKSAYSAYLIVQPREFGSDQAGGSFNPKPRTDFGVVYKHTF